MSTHRDEAIKAIEHVVAMLESPEQMDGFRWHLVRTTLQYAAAEVAAIEEVKRHRRPKAPAETT
mgnify:FL=1